MKVNYKKINIFLGLSVFLIAIVLGGLFYNLSTKNFQSNRIEKASIQPNGEFHPTGAYITPGGTSPSPPAKPQAVLNGYYVNAAKTFFIRDYGWKSDTKYGVTRLISNDKNISVRIEEVPYTNSSIESYGKSIIKDPTLTFTDIVLDNLKGSQTSVYESTTSDGKKKYMSSALILSKDKTKIYSFTLEINRLEDQVNALGLFHQQLGSFGYISF